MFHMVSTYPGILRACFALTMGCGGLNRDHGSLAVTQEAEAWLLGVEENENWNLPVIDAWLAGLSDDDMLTAAEGEETEMEALIAKAPEGTRDLLNGYYDKCCGPQGGP